jgi:hypothetical protein
LKGGEDVASKDPILLAFAAQMRRGELHVLLPENFDVELLLRELLVPLRLYLMALLILLAVRIASGFDAATILASELFARLPKSRTWRCRV